MRKLVFINYSSILTWAFRDYSNFLGFSGISLIMKIPFFLGFWDIDQKNKSQAFRIFGSFVPRDFLGEKNLSSEIGIPKQPNPKRPLPVKDFL